MSLILNESLVLAKTRSQDLKSVLKLNCWGSGIKDVSLVRQLVNVEVIGLSCNEITGLEDFAYCKKLKELILRKNKIDNIAEVAHLQALPNLTVLWLGENPCATNTYNYRKVVLKALPNLKVLDNIPVTREEMQEIEDLGNEIYEEVPYESSHSSGSGPSSAPTNQRSRPTENISINQQTSIQQDDDYIDQSECNFQSTQLADASMNFPSGPPLHQQSSLNDARFINSSSINSARTPNRPLSRTSNVHQTPKPLPSQDSNLNGSQYQSWSMSNNNISGAANNNNNNISNLLPKGGKSRNGNILSAVLCLVKELDYVSCEVVQTALHCRMEETSQ